ncbi:MAG: hypothetical protein QOG67_3019 [Verrucomicrobiota bacterium]|jgi:hypothetical protein
MSFIHSREYLNEGDVVVLDCDRQCNFMITTDSNFSSYKRRDAFTSHCGHFKRFPARIGVPHSDNCKVTIDLAGGWANIRYNLSYLKG